MAFMVYQYSPFFSFPYDWDPSDGDYWGLARRVSMGLPIYGNWAKGEIISLYPPLVPYFFGLIDLFGLETLSIARVLQVGCLIGSSFLVGDIAARATGKHRIRYIAGISAGLFQMSAWRLYPAFLNFRSDPWVVLFVLLTIRQLIATPSRVFLIATLASCSFFAKQSGIAVIPAAIGFYALFERRHFWPFIGAAAFALLVPIGVLEVWNHGQYLSSTVFAAMQYLTGPSKQSWAKFVGLWEAFFANREWIYMYGLSALALGIAAWRKNRVVFVVGVVLAFDLLYLSQGARYFGAGVVYFWTHWQLCSILVGYTLGQLILGIGSVGGRFLPTRLAAVFVSIIALLPLFHKNLRILFEQVPLNLAYARDIGIREDQTVAELRRQFPGRWLVERAPASTIRNKIVLEREWCTLGGALMDRPDDTATQEFLTQLRTGVFQIIQRGPGFSCGEPPGYQQMLAQCFEPVSMGQVVSYGAPVSITFLKHTPTRPECKP